MLEIRTLTYFLTIAREGSFTKAAAVLHVSQPTLSRQIRALEEDYGKELFYRTTQHLSLTSDGILLQKYAEEILAISQKAELELRAKNQQISGDIYIGCGESLIFQRVMKAAHKLQQKYPAVHFHIITGDGSNTLYDLDKGFIDIAFMYGDVDPAQYNILPIPEYDYWGVIMKDSEPLAQKKEISPEDLWDKPLILSRNTLIRSTHGDSLKQWFRKPFAKLYITNSYTMAFNAALMASEGMGYVIAFSNLIRQTNTVGICIRPLCPIVKAAPSIVWKKYGILSTAAEAFLTIVKKEFAHP